MKRSLLILGALFYGMTASAQKVEFEEYTLNNGLKVILHQDKSAPVIITSVMYHVGAKDENLNVQDLHTSLSTYYLKEQKILNAENGLSWLLQMVVKTTRILRMIEPTTTKCFHQII